MFKSSLLSAFDYKEDDSLMADLQYIPKLKLYYNKITDEYVTGQGLVVDHSNISVVSESDDEDSALVVPRKKSLFSFDGMHVSIATVIQVIALTAAIYTQYNALTDGISANDTQLKLYKVANDEKMANLQVLQTEVEKLHAEISLQEDMIKSIQMRLASIKK